MPSYDQSTWYIVLKYTFSTPFKLRQNCPIVVVFPLGYIMLIYLVRNHCIGKWAFPVVFALAVNIHVPNYAMSVGGVNKWKHCRSTLYRLYPNHVLIPPSFPILFVFEVQSHDRYLGSYVKLYQEFRLVVLRGWISCHRRTMDWHQGYFLSELTVWHV